MKIIRIEVLPAFRLQLFFNEGTSGFADLHDLAGRGVFQAWDNPGIFEQVKITPTGALEWPGEIDLCPDSLYLRATGQSPGEIFPALQASGTRA